MTFRGVGFALMMVGTGLVFGSPVVPGLHGKHPLSLAQKGGVLADELGCAACHEGMAQMGQKAAPDLSEVGSRISGDYLKRYLADPHGTHPGTTMPDVLAGLPDDEKKKVSESISHYLRSLTSADEKAKAVEGSPKRGQEIYHEVGCIACHSPRDSDGKEVNAKGVASLAHLGSKYQHGELAEFLGNPLKVRASGRMPNLNLSSSEAASLEAYLGGEVKAVSVMPTADQVKLGKANFETFNCVACHTMDGMTAKAGPALAEMDLNKGCLTGKGVDYELDESQKKEIQAAFKKAVKLSDDDRVKVKMTQLNCIACHKRDDFGGVADELDAFFHSTEEALGDAARIPPPLTKIGGKLKPEWMNKVLYDGLLVRPYMTTRMPQYGRKALAGLPELLVKLDQLPVVELPPPGREDRPMVSNGGHLLLGTDGLSCITCHNYNGKEGPGMKGLDLITTYQRLQPGWFYEFMKNPAKHRPGIIMPNYWPGGKAVQTDILGGDTHEQLRALWYQFSLGRSARDPKGLRSEPNKLVVTDKVRVYRGRSRIAGYRGIAVGYPGGMNYAFNAQNGALSGIWTGEYVTANWRSQGAGDFDPIPRAIELAQDVGFMPLKGEDQKWPLSPITTKENPVISDPLYPGNFGYAFKGYSFDQSGNPTFSYLSGEVMIEDRSVAKGEKVLCRSFALTSPKKGVLYFRALTGKVKAESDLVFATTELRLKVGDAETLLRPTEIEGEQELLIKIPVAEGKTNYTIDYEILR
ncbi:MAG: mono/diheme cytochrome c family protein [Akkermansiaceae bacterium]|jgi:mono/diheme cytochrome c family protein